MDNEMKEKVIELLKLRYLRAHKILSGNVKALRVLKKELSRPKL